MKLQQNNYAFIDSQNLNLAIRGQGWKLDFARFRQYLKDNFSVTKAFLFIGYVAGNESLYTFLQKASYIVIFKPTLEKLVGGVKQIKGNVDAELVLQISFLFYLYQQSAGQIGKTKEKGEGVTFGRNLRCAFSS